MVAIHWKVLTAFDRPAFSRPDTRGSTRTKTGFQRTERFALPSRCLPAGGEKWRVACVGNADSRGSTRERPCSPPGRAARRGRTGSGAKVGRSAHALDHRSPQDHRRTGRRDRTVAAGDLLPRALPDGRRAWPRRRWSTRWAKRCIWVFRAFSSPRT